MSSNFINKSTKQQKENEELKQLFEDLLVDSSKLFLWKISLITPPPPLPKLLVQSSRFGTTSRPAEKETNTIIKYDNNFRTYEWILPALATCVPLWLCLEAVVVILEACQAVKTWSLHMFYCLPLLPAWAWAKVHAHACVHGGEGGGGAMCWPNCEFLPRNSCGSCEDDRIKLQTSMMMTMMLRQLRKISF